MKKWIIYPTIRGMPWGIGFQAGACVGWYPTELQFWIVLFISAIVSSLLEELIDYLGISSR